MAILPLHRYPDPVLQKRARQVTSIDGRVQQLIDDMVETMHHANGVGLAAPQVGVSLRVAVIEMPGEEVLTLINPKIVKRQGEREVVEGCLSVPGYRGVLTRSERVTAKGLDRWGKEVRIKGEGLLAQALEHEVDHLDGVLYIDHLDDIDQLERLDAEAETPEI